MIGDRSLFVVLFSLLLMFAIAQPAHGQTLTVGQVEAPAGATVAVPIFVSHDFDLAAFVLAVTFDNESLVDSYVPEIFIEGAGVPCPAFVGAITYACSTPQPNQFNYVVNSGSPAIDVPAGQFGIVTFQISDSAQPDDVIVLTIVSESYSDQDGNVIPPSGDSEGGSITIIDVASVLNVSPTELLFEDTFTGSTSSVEEFTIENEGSDGVPLEVTGFSLTGPFSLVSGGSCDAVPFSLEDSESCTQRVVFGPTADGPASGTLTVLSDATEVTNASVALSGEGIPPPVDLVVVQSPDYGVVGGPIYGTIVVHVLDTNGDLFAADSSTVVEMSIVTDPSGLATLSGETQVTVSNGIAVFDDLSIDQVGTGFVLRASDQSGDLDSGDSDAFAVLPLDLFQDRFQTLD